MSEIRLGYVPLTDAAVLIAAAERGFAARHGVALRLERVRSWAAMRDKLALGLLDGAHLLAPLAVAMSLGLGPGPRADLVVPFVLNLNGNAVTLSRAVWQEVAGEGGHWDPAAFGRIARARAAAGTPLVLATVFPYSTHTFILRRLLQQSGLDPERDVLVTVVPPPQAAAAVAEGAVDGFCVGAPWNSVAVAEGAGRIVAFGSDLLPDAVEKVLALPRGHLPDERLAALVVALAESAAWCADPANHPRLAELLAKPRHLDTDPDAILRTLDGRLRVGDGIVADAPDYLRLGGEVHRPDPAYGDWIVERMREAGQLAAGEGRIEAARAVFRPSFFDCI